MQGTIVDSKYQVVRLLGQGGMGAVYEARHLGTGRRVALKVIVPEALLGGGDIIPRFQREARASGAIDSQHVVQVLDTGVDPQTKSPYLVMEHLTGQDLQQLVQRVGALAPDVVLRIMAQACAGLSRAHDEGIVHRDIKAANLYVARREGAELIIKILDFGIAKVRADPMSASAHQGITRTGSMLGSPLYMPPEQVIGTKDVDPRSDIFSLGVTMYEALCGVTPNQESETIGALVLAICGGKGQPLQQRAPWLPRNVVAIVEKALALEPSARFQTTAEMHAAITALLPQGTSLHESMLVGASPGLQGTVAMPFAQTPREPAPSAVSAPSLGSAPPFTPGVGTAPPFTPGVGLPHSAPALPMPVVATTANAFTGTAPGPRQSKPVWLLALPVALLLLVGVGVGLYKLRPPQAGSSVPAAVSSTSAAARGVELRLPGFASRCTSGVMGTTRRSVEAGHRSTDENGVRPFKEECL